ncbi:MAG: carbon-nitrogen hydrolase [Solirubrobacteraceae bacterium]
MNNTYLIAAIQLELNNLPEVNLKKCIDWIKKAAQKGANIVCLPELYNSHYFCQSEDIENYKFAEPSNGKSFIAFSSLAKELKVTIIVPFFEKTMPGLYFNSTLIINSNGTLNGIYRKMHIPDDPSFYEKFYFTPGDLGFQNFKTEQSNIGVLICWDQWFPEAARLTALKGSEVIFYPTAIGWHPSEKVKHGKFQKEAWKNAMKGHAVCNGIYIAAANRIGLEKYLPNTDGLEFWGSSFIAGPQGEILIEASEDKEEIIMAEVNVNHLEYVRQNWPFFRDRRVDAFGNLTKRSLL